MKTFKVKYISDKASVFFEKGEVYNAFLPKDNLSGSFFAFHIDDIDEPGEYALPASRFEIIEERTQCVDFMTKVVIQEKFHTSMGRIFRVKNDRVFAVGEIIDFDEGKYRINRVMFSSNPDDAGYINLVVTKAV